MRTPSIVRRMSLPLLIILFAAVYVLFSTNMADWLQTHGGLPIAEVLMAR